jgi:hypothetical protein
MVKKRVTAATILGAAPLAFGSLSLKPLAFFGPLFHR